jgi:hypothetical protein
MRLIETPEFQRDTKSEKQREILGELFIISEAISNVRSFVDIPKEKPYIGWEAKNPREKQNIQTLYRFSCKTTVKIIFKITEIQDFKRAQWNTNRRTRKPYNGWWFMELEKYKKKMAKKDQHFEPDSLLNYINITTNEKKPRARKNI